MISILVPCFDYNAYPLVSLLEKQALMLKINFEIICIDDGSFSSKNELNQKINLLTNSRFIESKKNIGRVKNRLLLAEKSQYEFLLFIDVDTTPSNENFLKNYLAQLHKGRIIFGGCNYKNPENKNSSLRYKLQGPVSMLFTNSMGVFPISSDESLIIFFILLLSKLITFLLKETRLAFHYLSIVDTVVKHYTHLRII